MNYRECVPVRVTWPDCPAPLGYMTGVFDTLAEGGMLTVKGLSGRLLLQAIEKGLTIQREPEAQP